MGDSIPDETGLNLPDCGSGWVDVDAGFPACGIREGGCVECWSNDPRAEYLVDGVPNARFTEVSVQDEWDPSWESGVICGIGVAGLTHCWGGEVPIEGELRSISVGELTTCAILKGRSLICVGRYVEAVEISGTVLAVDTAPLEGGWCAAPTDGGIQCDDGYVAGVRGRFTQISNDGHGRGCGVRDDGSAACWNPAFGTRELESKGTIAAVAHLVQSAVVLRTDGRLEAIPLTGDGPDLPQGAFRAIDDRGTAMCAVRADGSDIECFDYQGRSLPGPDDDTPTW